MTREAMVLACLVEPGTPAGPARAWARQLAPEVSLRMVSGAFTPAAPYALLGSGELGMAAIALAERLAGNGRGPARVLVCDCPPPDRQVAPGCPVVGFARPEFADRMAAWRTAGAPEFTLRRFAGYALPPRGPVSPDVAIAIKEELSVWPS